MSNDLGDLAELLKGYSPEAKRELDREIGKIVAQGWMPNPGPQLDAYVSQADLLLYGGAAGGGKTDLLIGLALTQHERSVIFRRAYVDLRGCEERLIQIAGRDGYNGSDMVMKRPGRLIEFGALEKPGAEFSWQGRPHDLIAFDEGAQLAEIKVQFVMGWLRTTTKGQRARVVIASNPPIGGEGNWLMEWFAPWLDPIYPNPARDKELRWAVSSPTGKTVWVDGPGVHAVNGEPLTALSRTFIPARLNDNPYLKGTNYRAQIQGMPEPLRTKLLEGDFLTGKEDAENQVIPSSWIEAAQERWHRGRPTGKMLALGVDVAQGGPDQTVLAPLYGVWFDNLVRRAGVDTRNGPAVGGLVIETMRDSCQVTIDLTGGWGISAKDHLTNLRIPVLGVVFSAASPERVRDGTIGFFNLRAQMMWQLREALDPLKGDKIALPPDRRLAAEMGAPTWRMKGDKILVESKDDIRKRLGSSTDSLDAVMLAWFKRDRALYIQKTDEAERNAAYVEDFDPYA